MSAMMKAIVLDRFGDESELQERTVAVPAVGERDVLIRVEGAGIGSWDRFEFEGEFEGAFRVPSVFPYILGGEGAGVVEEVGDEVTRFEVVQAHHALRRHHVGKMALRPQAGRTRCDAV